MTQPRRVGSSFHKKFFETEDKIKELINDNKFDELRTFIDSLSINTLSLSKIDSIFYGIMKLKDIPEGQSIYIEFKKLHEEKMQERREELRKISKDFIIGYYLGELMWISHNGMPTISTGMCTSRNCIKVSEEDTKRIEEASDKWYNLIHDKTEEERKVIGKIEWEEYQKIRIEIDEKYLPKEFLYHTNIWIEESEELKKGLISSLWNSDGCCYSLKAENITFQYDYYCTSIKFIYEKE